MLNGWVMTAKQIKEIRYDMMEKIVPEMVEEIRTAGAAAIDAMDRGGISAVWSELPEMKRLHELMDKAQATAKSRM